ncbi:GINS complex subunit [Teratosphaeriaceae sp. CCFEE 6253]|nr:GINS complex subunit [Teratosphaeriaceae sp. CCFEE 6253]
MDDDIADILASVSAPITPQRTLDLQALTRAWIAERTAPELLPYPTDLIDRVMDRVKEQIEVVETMTGTQDPQANFTLVILQTELERFKFLVRSFLRARIAKIDAFPFHCRLPPQSSLLSALEHQYLSSHQSLLSSHYSTSFLSTFPANLQKLDDTAGGISMVDAPDGETAVFCRVLRDAGTVEVQSEGAVSDIELMRGDVRVLRWSAVRDGVRRGDVELI